MLKGQARNKILVTNDDGIDSIGLKTLVTALQGLGDVWVVAPDRDRSGCSHTLTQSGPVRLWKLAERCRTYVIDGTSADCVYLSLSHLLADHLPDIIISGINSALNIADDVTYSGTVGATLEAALLDIRSVAISVASFTPETLKVAGDFAVDISNFVLKCRNSIPRGVFLNVNIPHKCGNYYKFTKMGRRQYTKEVTIKKHSSYTDFFVGGTAMEHENITDSDCNCVLEDGLISVTPIQIDMTSYETLEDLKGHELSRFEQIK